MTQIVDIMELAYGDRWLQYLDDMPAGFAILMPLCDAQGGIVDFRFDFLNTAGRRLLGCAHEASSGRTLVETFSPAHCADVLNWSREVMHTGESLSREMPCTAGDVGQPGQGAMHVHIARYGDGIAVTWQDARPPHQAERVIDNLPWQVDQFDTIVAALPVAVFLIDLQGHIVQVNPAARAILGQVTLPIDRLELLQRLDQRTQDGEPLTVDQMPSSHALRGETVERVHMRIRAEDASARMVQVTAAPLLAQGKIHGAISIWHDITDQEQAKRQLEEEHVRLLAVLEQMPSAVIMADASTGAITLANARVDEVLRQTCMDVTELTNRPTYQAFHTDGHPFAPDDWPLARAMAHGKAIRGEEITIRRADGTRAVVSCNASPIKDQSGRIIAGVEIFDDITKRKEAELALRTSEETSRALLNATSDAACLLDRDGTLLAANEEMSRRIALPVDALIGRNFVELLPDDARPVCRMHIDNALQSGQRVMFEDEYNGRCFHHTYSPIHDDAGAVLRLAVFCRDITEQKRTQAQLHQLAFYDHLTGLPNRFMLLDRLTQALAQMKRQRSTTLALLFLDLDHFKTVNDTLGHHFGDALLLEVANRLSSAIREGDTVARMGGDEFVFIINGLRDPRHDVERTIARILNALKVPVRIQHTDLQISASIGVALAPDDGITPEQLMKNADVAMYRAKDAGRQTYRFLVDDAHVSLIEGSRLEEMLSTALEHQDLVLYYQPQYAMHTGKVVGVEALLRWKHPELGQIPPLHFLPAAEKTSMALPVAEWVLQQACGQVAAWRHLGIPDVKLAVNISPRQFTHRQFVDSVARNVQASGLSPHLLELEIPGHLLLARPQYAQETLHRLHQLGVRLAIDDVGIGHYSVQSLHHFPVHTVKIDGSCIRTLTDDASSAETINNIVQFGRHWKLSVVAECVETAEQLAILREYGCNVYQGFLASKPLPAAACAELLRMA